MTSAKPLGLYQVPDPGAEYVRRRSFRKYRVGHVFAESWGFAVVVEVMHNSLGSSHLPIWDIRLRRLGPDEEAVYSVLHG